MNRLRIRLIKVESIQTTLIYSDNTENRSGQLQNTNLLIKQTILTQYKLNQNSQPTESNNYETTQI